MTELSSLSTTAGELLKERGHTISVSESSCGGLLSASLVSVSGASAYYVGGAIIYTRVGQAGLLRVPDEAMEGQRASTEYYAALNALTLREILGTTWALSETGASGPTGNRYGDDGGPRLYRRLGSNRARHHRRDGRQRPRSQHVGILKGRFRTSGAVHPRGRLILQSRSGGHAAALGGSLGRCTL